MYHHARKVFFFLRWSLPLSPRLELEHSGTTGQFRLYLLTLNDPPASASQSAGITGVSHRTQPKFSRLQYINYSHHAIQEISRTYSSCLNKNSYSLTKISSFPSQPHSAPAPGHQHSTLHFYDFNFFFLRRSFALVTQAGVQWHNPGSLQPSPSEFK